MTDRISVNCQARLTEAITCLSTMFREKKYVVRCALARTARSIRTGCGSRCTSASPR